MPIQQLRSILPPIAILALLATLGPAFTAEDDLIVLKAGREGHIRLDSTVVAGDLTLRPGNHSVQHRAEGGDNFVRFTRVDWRRSPSDKSRRRVALIEAQVTCEVEKLQKPVESTAFYTRKEGNTTRLTRVEIKSETIAHLF